MSPIIFIVIFSLFIHGYGLCHFAYRIGSKTKCVGHRGYPVKYPENTFISLEETINIGAEGIESDVRLTKDGQVIMMHDTTLDRTTNGTGSVDERYWNGYIEYLVTEKNEKVPKLQKVLDLLKREENKNIFFIMDIKEDNDIKILDAIADLIYLNKPYNFQSQIYLGIWTYDFLIKARQVLPHLPISYIGSNISVARDQFFDKVESFNMEYTYILEDTSGFFAQIRNSGKKLFVWTVDSENDMRGLFSYGVDAILSNDPVKCLSVKKKGLKIYWKSTKKFLRTYFFN
ncbi:PLC-like phosphodiesterase [Gigaspora margarita]|uniref:PLC-like phosphodiesterase n=1 Tax=Gigaspora margarita TaxID=4874 RepID=A0A8H4ADY2_GIGMA|nr:PLC-like phosphodiesterase [Gigaspora margarita]